MLVARSLGHGNKAGLWWLFLSTLATSTTVVLVCTPIWTGLRVQNPLVVTDDSTSTSTAFSKSPANNCHLEFDNANRTVLVGGLPWLSLGHACLRYNGQEFCHDTRDDNIVFNDHDEQQQQQQQGADPLGDLFVQVSQTLEMGPLRKKWKIWYKKYDSDSTDTLLFGQDFVEPLLQTEYPAESALASAENGMASLFPSFHIHHQQTTSDKIIRMGYLQLHGLMAGQESYRIGSIGDLLMKPQKSALSSGPLALFTDACVLVMSTASSFMSTSSLYRPEFQEYGFGVLGSVTTIPAGHQLSVILSSSPRKNHPNDGIRQAFRQWGAKLMKYYNTQRPSDETIHNLQYNTDNGKSKKKGLLFSEASTSQAVWYGQYGIVG
jgi:hypothetical protein